MLRSIAVGIFLAATAAHADHGIFNATASSASANTVLQLEQQLGRYEVEGDVGQYSISYLQVEFALLRQLSVTAGMPWVTIMPSNGSSVAGVGDSMAGLKYQLTAPDTDGASMSLGFNVELPTGDANKRIGGDHYGIEGAFAIAKRVSSSLQIISRLSHSFAPNHNHGHGHGHSHGHEHDLEDGGGVIRPHGEQESTALVSLVYATEMQFVEAALRGGVAYEHNETYAAPVDLILRAGYNIGKMTTVVSSLSQTVGGEFRTPWTISLGLTVNYERHPHSHSTEQPEAHHDHHDHHDHDDHHDHHDHHEQNEVGQPPPHDELLSTKR